MSARRRASRNERVILELEEASDLCVVIPCVFHALHVIMNFTVKKRVVRGWARETHIDECDIPEKICFTLSREAEYALTNSWAKVWDLISRKDPTANFAKAAYIPMGTRVSLA